MESGNNINTDMNIVNKTLVIIIHELKGTVYKNVLFCSDTIQIMVFIYTEMKLNIKCSFIIAMILVMMSPYLVYADFCVMCKYLYVIYRL